MRTFVFVEGRGVVPLAKAGASWMKRGPLVTPAAQPKPSEPSWTPRQLCRTREPRAPLPEIRERTDEEVAGLKWGGDAWIRRRRTRLAIRRARSGQVA
jgi:hypothetical protein